MGAVKALFGYQMSILSSLPTSEASPPQPHNKWLLLALTLVMMAKNKQKPINNILLQDEVEKKTFRINP